MITYHGKKFEFHENEGGALDIPADTLPSLPKAVLLLLLAGAARGSLPIAEGTHALLSDKMGKYLDNGQLNDKGRCAFRNDRELLAALRMPSPAAHTPATTSLIGESAADSPDNADADAADSNASTASDTAADTRENADASANSTDAPSPASDVSADAPPTPRLTALLSLIRQFLLRFMVFADPAQVVAVSLWIVHTWTIDAFRITPYLFIHSPTKRCGKSRLLECLHALTCRPWSVVSATEAVVMRMVDAEKPTLLFDEIDTVYRSSRDKSKEGMRAVLNCGFARGAKVPRCAGREIIEYSVFCPKAFAGIGDRLPDTIKDRSIRIHLIRRGKDQEIEKLRFRDVEELTKTIVEGLTSWAADEDVIQNLQDSRPIIPDELGDRAADIAEPLLAIADLAGDDWAKASRASLVTLLRANDDEEADEPGVRLLSAIRDIFAMERKKQLPTAHILRKLAVREEEEAWTMQWPREFTGGNTRGPAAKMASLLRPYGISAGTIRLPDGSTPKGYRLEAFTDAFARYLPPILEKVATSPHGIVDQPPKEPTDTEETGLDNT